MSSIDEFHVWIDRENLWLLQRFLVLWAFACCLYASAKIGRKLHDKTDRFLSGLFYSPKLIAGIAWAVGQLGMLGSMIACFYAAMAFSYSEDSLINIKARQTLTDIMSFPEEQRVKVFAYWLKEKVDWNDWQ